MARRTIGTSASGPRPGPDYKWQPESDKELLARSRNFFGPEMPKGDLLKIMGYARGGRWVRRHLRGRPAPYPRYKSPAVPRAGRVMARGENGERMFVMPFAGPKGAAPEIGLLDGRYATDIRSDDLSKPTVVTVLEEQQEFGGPEEGGWYYNAAGPVKTRWLPRGASSVELRDLLNELSRTYPILYGQNQPPYHSYKFVVSNAPESGYPRHRPRYE